VTLTIVSNDLEAEMPQRKNRCRGALAMYTATSQAGPTTVLVDETRLEQARKLLPDG
jgi:hypothetical protein